MRNSPSLNKLLKISTEKQQESEKLCKVQLT